MLSLNATQQALVASDNKEVRWAFYVYDKNGVGYSFVTEPLGAVAWATGITWDSGLTWDSGEGLSSGIVLTDFSGIELRRNMAENTVIAPSEVSFNISNSGNVLDFADFKGGSVLIELYLSNATYGDQKIAGWKFRIKTADPSYQTLKITAEDFLQSYLRGSYPNTDYPQTLFPSNRTYSNGALCVPVPFGTAYVPLRDVFISGAGYLVLGSPSYTYTISKIRSPRSWGLKSEYSSSDYTFTQSTQADGDSVDWRVFQAIIADSTSDGVADAHGFWGTPGSAFLDPPVELTRSDTATLTNPADVLEFVLEDMGVPSAMIDATTFASAKATYTSWGLEFNGAFWYKQDRQKVLSQLLTMCHSCLDVGDTLKLRVLSKTSKDTITGADVLRTSEQGEGTFSYRDLVNEDYSDSGYIAYQPSGEAQDELQKVLVAVDGSASVISSEVIECPFVQDSQDVKRIGQLHFERKLMRQAEAGFTGKGTLLALQPDDVITINDSNYGGSYVVLVDSIKISKDIALQFVCSDFSVSFSDWGDISPTALVIPSDTSTASWQPVMAGPDTTFDVTGTGSNFLPGRVKVGGTDDYILLEPADPIQVSVYEAGVEKIRMGNLNGFLGFSTDVYGLAGGDTDEYIKIDTTTGKVSVSGSIEAGTIDIGGSDDSSFHVDADGNLWLGAETFNIATNPFAVSKAGVLRAVSGTIGGFTLGATTLTATNLSLDSSGQRISLGSGNDIIILDADDATYRAWVGNATAASAPFSVTKAGSIYSTSGTIGGWTLDSTMLKSGASGTARIELDQNLKRISVKDATDASKVVMGYLNGLVKNDGTGNWGASDYGFWAASGDYLKIDGDVDYKSGDWIVRNDGSLLINNAADQTIIRLGTDTGEKGLFIYDTSATQLGKFISDKIYVGKEGAYFQYTTAGGLEIFGPTEITGGVLTATNIDAAIITGSEITGSVLKTAATGQRTEITSAGIALVTSGTSGKYGGFKYGTGVKYGSGVRAWINNTGRNVPFYCSAATNYGDFHYVSRASDPTGAAEVGDTCCVGGVIKACTVAGTPGTWVAVGSQT